MSTNIPELDRLTVTMDRADWDGIRESIDVTLDRTRSALRDPNYAFLKTWLTQERERYERIRSELLAQIED